MSQFTILAGRTIAAATLFGAFLSIVPLHEGRAQQAAQPAQTVIAHAKHAADRSETRIKDLHDRLQITPAQEPLWGNVAQIMRENGETFRASVTDRSTRQQNMTAIDDLKSFQTIADQQSSGLKRLIPSFEALYASMTPAQQKRADRVFAKHEHHAHS